MQKQKIQFEISYLKPQDLSVADTELLASAHEALNTSYSPYSNFKVGAALRLASGTIVQGSNQENASFPAGLCAERVAVFQAGVRFPGEVIETIAIAVSGGSLPATPAAPCGNCRQAILEYELRQDRPIRYLLAAGNETVVAIPSTRDLLPLGFDSSYLKQ
ncbi:cytidine deaminase [Robiginitalea myxolifaciens]|uniref:Cytidine deaminase n=1 Tax=Robiginitalea myxolifaciens TaxID=400055 RepID=A0A1I6HJB5_9FLAO|nr:cytidine deaminase [Robiginitalea myxolifaciens]SFR54496.1 cytidine deaminase [Robiginitalea myxolifaciens]